LPDWKKWTCESINPGTTHLPLPSIRVAPAGTGVELAGPIASMRLPAMITVLFEAKADGPSRSG